MANYKRILLTISHDEVQIDDPTLPSTDESSPDEIDAKENLPSQKLESKNIVKVLRKTFDEPRGKFRGAIATVRLLLELPPALILLDSGSEKFGECVIKLMKSHNPFKSDRTIVSIAIDGGDNNCDVSTQFKPIGDIKSFDVVRCIEKSEHDIDLGLRQTSVIFTYLNPPRSN
ncbi:hypothetical protein GCK72_013163 [Caenorhabditis remanei]|uniref:Uncharacterized protein n=1 Tax=Caenorhabditis remanei TaxID=31234 RepID=A0A6A5GMV2_CAERE|nr:hypothetical protein GCK72_013162 [Caenorhabditis remanei]XP_003095280.2 hypothetical protein GCK72_013163 [Caenorhabditis remanei]KAF1756708.1 hypothetical protein GCK72_013162 [Caenorhabditis remanei]KAF1756709.1 hypothetical protein GCK72_013163 [Caenorhabditis remanei]